MSNQEEEGNSLVLWVAVAISAISLAFLAGYMLGWEGRIHYEVLQCADHGRCFH